MGGQRIKIIPVGTVLNYGWVVASLRRHPIEQGGKMHTGVDAICPMCFEPSVITYQKPASKCRACIAQEGGAGQRRGRKPHNPDRWRSLVAEASAAFRTDFRYAEDMALWVAMRAYGEEIKAERSRV